ncbi:MAG: hypothetical protein LC541_18130 [Candidatus Thiodiazotropha sp.]|nr:hypothetical protein [Candidatus Thiodiazotropha sp.]MCM8885188.1 hypothetical protein [Candidatus Thiodiazotropha sp.]
MTGRRVRMLALHPLWRKARRVYSLASRLPGTNRLGFQPSLALSEGRQLHINRADHPTRLQRSRPPHRHRRPERRCRRYFETRIRRQP